MKAEEKENLVWMMLAQQSMNTIGDNTQDNALWQHYLTEKERKLR